MQSMDIAEVMGSLLEGRTVEVTATFKLGEKPRSSA